MAEVEFTLYDIGGGHLAGKYPEVIFALNDPGATAGGGIYVTEPLVVVPPGDGAVTFDLPTTDLMRDDVYYTMQIRWQDLDGNTSRVDYPDWHIRVPTGGGKLSDLRGPGTNMSMVYVSLTRPDEALPWTWWFEQDPDDINNPANTSRLYRWENI